MFEVRLTHLFYCLYIIKYSSVFPDITSISRIVIALFLELRRECCYNFTQFEAYLNTNL